MAAIAEAPTREARVIHTDAKPSGRQIYRICRDLCAIAGVDFPETRAAASALIEHVAAQRAALAPDTAKGDGDDIPF